MKKMNFLFVFITATLLLSMAHSAVWFVSNTGNLSADFTSLSNAHNGASAGDTLYVEGSETGYGSWNVSKQLTVFGPGYFLDENPETQVNLLPAWIQSINFNAGSEYSKVSGCYVSAGITLNTSNLTIERNYVHINSVYTWVYCIDITNNSFSNTIRQNYLMRSGTTNVTTIDINANSIENVISNNYIYSQGNSIIGVLTASSSINNNVMDGNIDVHYTMLQNNIYLGGNYSGTNNLLLNNISYNSDFGTDNGNISEVDMESGVFVGTGSTDGQWMLAEGSPAEGAGYEGVDCGMYGGAAPYVLSGMPNIPAIFFLDAPQVIPFDSDQMEIQIQAKTHSEE